MKRILAGLFVTAFAISGCSGAKSETITFMAKNKAGNLYALYNTEGIKLTDYKYKNYQEVKNAGYIVKNNQNQYRFINYEGKEIINRKYIEGTNTLLTTYSTPSTNLQFEKNDLTLEELSSTTLNLQNASSTPVYTSSNNKIVTVDQNGVVSAIKAGQATITARIGDESVDALVTVTPITPKLSTDHVKLNVGETQDIAVLDNRDREVKWSSADDKIATVDATGHLTALKKGTTTIIAKTGDDTLKVKVEVNEPVVTANLKKTTVFSDDDPFKINLNGVREGEKVKWSSGNKRIALVDQNGQVTPKKAGKVTITASVMSQKINVLVTVKKRDLRLKKKSYDLTVGQETNVEIKDLKSNTTVTYQLANPNIVSIDEYGKMKALKKGTTTIKATVGKRKLKAQVHVSHVKVAISQKEASLIELETLQLSVKNSDPNSPITWSSNKKDIAEVDNNGLVTAKKKGTATITATIDNKKYQSKITVKKRILSLNKENIVLTEDEETKVGIRHLKADAPVTYKSADEKIAKIENGILTAIKSGKTKITLLAEGKKFTTTVTVKDRHITLEKNEKTLMLGKNYQIKVKNAGKRTLSFKTGKKDVIEVDEKGEVRALNPGEDIVTVQAGDTTLKCKFIVKEEKLSVPSRMTLIKGTTGTIQVKNLVNQHIIWASDNPEVASVDEAGTITAHKAGEAIISATISNQLYHTTLIVKRDPNTLVKTKNIPLSYKQTTIMNAQGKTIYEANGKVAIKKTAVPVLYEKGYYRVLYDTKDDLYKGKEEVMYTLGNENVFVIVFNHKLKIFMSQALSKPLSLDEGGNYKIMASNDHQVVLYDADNKAAVVADVQKNMIACVDQEVTKASLSNNNIMLENSSGTYLINKKGQSVRVNSYYQDSEHYLKRDEQYVYGPHLVINGQKTNKLKDVQLKPAVTYLEGKIYPAYVKDQGFVYYDMNGKKAFDKVFIDAQASGVEGAAIAIKKNHEYVLLDEEGKELLTSKQRIAYIGDGYYAHYKADGSFAVVSASGDEMLEDKCTSFKEDAVVHINENNYMILNRNGRNYVYDADNGFKVIFSTEEPVKLDTRGFIVVNERKYYDLKGKAIN